MSAPWCFDFDPKYTELGNEFSLSISADVKMINREGELSVDFAIFGDADEEIALEALDPRDRALLSDKAHNPPDHVLNYAQQEYEESKQPQYDKYAGL